MKTYNRITGKEIHLINAKAEDMKLLQKDSNCEEARPDCQFIREQVNILLAREDDREVYLRLCEIEFEK